MRYAVPFAVLVLAQIGAAWAIGDPNVARPGGAFSTVQVANAAACERLCADDTLCMAWSLRGNSCELKAIVPLAVAENGTTSGLSTRAPASMRAQPEAPVPAALHIAANEAEADSISEPLTDDSVAMALLGGPENGEQLRSRLGN
jgi:hypothetical protein